MKTSNLTIPMTCIVAALPITVTAGPLPAGESAGDSKPLSGVRNEVIRAVTEGKVPSFAIAVAKDGKILWEEAFGWADREKSIEATPNTMYSLASVSKPICATALMILVERGLINLDSPIDDYLGDVKLTAYEGNSSDATVRRMMSHRAGLPPHVNFFFEDEPNVRPDITEAIRRHGILCYPPGLTFLYSNLGYGIIGHVISRVSGRTLPQFLEQEVFLPLGMTRSSLGMGPATKKLAAVRYDRRGRPIPDYDFDHPGASGVYSSAHDLLRFGMFHLKNRLPDQERIVTYKTIDLMQSALPEDSRDTYGLGWYFGVDEHGCRTVNHGGSMPGVSTILRLIPSEDIAVVVLCNSDSSIVYNIQKEIVTALMPKLAKKSHEEPAAPKGNVSLSSELKGVWKGTIKTYEREIAVIMNIRNDDEIRVKLEGQRETPLKGVTFRNGYLFGVFGGEVPGEDTRRHPYILNVALRQSGEQLRGNVTANGLRDDLEVFSLSSYIRLTREEPSPDLKGESQ
ncbi:MAG: serine hydrolase domain-containing protein [Planctomycetota bacterium]|jgi:CubicO group peptidase (beta-lactamase class C family)